MAMNEGLANISLQIPVSLARRLDAKCEAERRAAPGTGSRSTVIRTALDTFLADVPDPKAAADETVALSSRGRSRAAILGIDGPRRRKREVAPASSPVRTRTRPVSQPLPAAE